MAPLTDPQIQKKIGEALSLWKYSGYVLWKPFAEQWLRENLEGQTTVGVSELLYLYFKAGGKVDQVQERRPEYLEYGFHYDFRINVGECAVYIETVLLDEPDDEPILLVVNIHEE